MTGLSLAFKIAPFAAIVFLLMALAVMRGDNIKANAAAVTANANAAQLQSVNEANAKTMAAMAAAEASNQLIAERLSITLANSNKRAEGARQQLKEAYHADPVARSWGDMPLPDGVRNALNAPPSPDAVPHS